MVVLQLTQSDTSLVLSPGLLLVRFVTNKVALEQVSRRGHSFCPCWITAVRIATRVSPPPSKALSITDRVTHFNVLGFTSPLIRQHLCTTLCKLALVYTMCARMLVNKWWYKTCCSFRVKLGWSWILVTYLTGYRIRKNFT